MPDIPYRGIQPFRYADHAIFFARERETRLLVNLVSVHRGVFLYGDSGNGKSSLVNAGLLPEAQELGFEPIRVRVQPRAGAELVVDQVAVAEEAGPQPFVFAPENDGANPIVLSTADFEARVRAGSAKHRPLILFDQFEEILTLFDDAEAVQARQVIVSMIGRLLRDPIPVKLVFAFREDYLGRVKQLLDAHPELVDQALRLGPLKADDLQKIIRGPFERFPGHFARELDEALAGRLGDELEQRFGSGEVSLSEVQTVCLRLWHSADPGRALTERGIQGLLEDELGEALAAFSSELRAAAVALLSQMVTSAGTRNVISTEDLRLRIQDEDDQIAPARIDEALERLEGEAKLIRREHRRDIDLYEITSEFLVPWISARREELRHAHERRRERRRLRILGSISGGLLIIVAVVAAVAVWAIGQRSEARRQAANATSLALATSAAAPSLKARPDVSLALAYEAYRASPRAEASEAVVGALLAARRSGLRSVLSGAMASAIAFTPDGALAAVDQRGLALWDPTTRVRRARGGPKADAEKDAIAFSPDGRSVVVASAEGPISVLDTADGRQLRQIRVERGPHTIINAAAWSPGSKTVAVATGDRTIELWSTASGKLLARLRSDRNVIESRAGVEVRTSRAVTALALSPDGRTLASGSDDGTISLWDTRSRARRARLGRSEGVAGVGGAGNVISQYAMNKVSALAFDDDGELLASASAAGTDLWKPATRRRLARLGRGADAVAFSRDGSTLASSDGPGIRLWNATSHQPIAQLTAADAESIESVSAIAFSPDGRLLATADPLGPMRLWTTATHRHQASRAGSNAYALAFAPDGSSLAVGSESDVALWDPRSHRRRTSLDAGSVEGVAFRPDGTALAVAGDQGTALWRPATRTRTKRLTTAGAAAVAFSPDRRLLASTSPGAITLWDAAGRQPRGEIPYRDTDGARQTADELAFSPDSALLASVGLDGVDVWNSTTRARIAHFRAPNSKIAFSRAHGLLAYSDGNAVVLYDTATRRRAGRFTIGESDDIDNHVSSLASSDDGRTLVVANSNGLTLWNPATRKRVGAIAEGSGALEVAISADGRTLATGSDLGGLRFYNDLLWSTPAQLRAAACEVLGGGLTASDWERYAAGIPRRRLTCP